MQPVRVVRPSPLLLFSVDIPKPNNLYILNSSQRHSEPIPAKRELPVNGPGLGGFFVRSFCSRAGLSLSSVYSPRKSALRNLRSAPTLQNARLTHAPVSAAP
jgi:hypothetical protein